MFAIPDLVGGTDGIAIGNLIKSQFLDSRDWPFGSALSIALTGCILLLVASAWAPRAPARRRPCVGPTCSGAPPRWCTCSSTYRW